MRSGSGNALPFPREFTPNRGSQAVQALSNNASVPVPGAAGTAGPTVDVTTQFTPKVSGKLQVTFNYKGTSSAATAVTTVVFTVGGQTFTMFFGPTTAPGPGFITPINFTEIVALGLAAVGVPQTISATHTTAGGVFGPDGQGSLSIVELPG